MGSLEPAFLPTGGSCNGVQGTKGEHYGKRDHHDGEVAGELPLCLHRAQRSKGGRLAVHVLPLAGAGPLRRLLLHCPLRRPGFHEGPTALRHPEAHDRLQLLPDPSQPVGFPESLLLLVDRPLQLALPARRLLQHRGRHAGRRHDLVVLLLKVHRLPRLLLLRAAEKMEPPQHTPCGSPWHHAFHCLVGHKVCRGRSHHFLRVPEHGSPCGDVFLLPHERHGPGCSKIPMVEKVPNYNAIGSIRDLLHPRLSSSHVTSPKSSAMSSFSTEPCSSSSSPTFTGRLTQRSQPTPRRLTLTAMER